MIYSPGSHKFMIQYFIMSNNGFRQENCISPTAVLKAIQGVDARSLGRAYLIS